jgi:hypothetical protein
VGVVGDVASGGSPRLAQSLGAAPFALYVPLQQRYLPQLTILARSSAERSLAGELHLLVTTLDPNLPVLAAQTLDSQRNGPIEGQLRISAGVAGVVGLVGLLLAGIGVYGVTAYSVSRRTREIGIRLSLGARRAEVIGLVLRQGMRLVAIGSILGMLLGAGVGVVLAGRFGIPAPGVALLAGAALLFAMTGLIACYAPVRRATGIRAMDALRAE